MILRVLLLIVMGLGMFSGSIASDVIRAKTDPPQLNQERYSPERMYRMGEYLELARDPWESLVPITKWPEAFREDALIGLTGHLGKRIGFAVEERSPGQFIFSIDLNMNGDLNDDPIRKMIRSEQGYVVDIQEDVILRIEIPDQDARFSWPVSYVYDDNYRSGIVIINDREVSFVVRGRHGKYDSKIDSLCVDQNGDGTVDYQAWESPECSSLKFPFVVIEERSYQFEIDADGGAITISTPEGELPERALLAVGTPAPNFDYVDHMGNSRSLSDHLGNVVLLYGWGTWCGPCRRMTPSLVKIYEAYKGCGFEIVGINRHDSLLSVLEYAERHSLSWPQTLQGSDGPILQLYRIQGMPYTMLIDQYGVIQGQGLRGDNLEAAIRDLVHQGAGSCATSLELDPSLAELRLDEIQSEIVELAGIQPDPITDVDIREARGLLEEYFVHLGEYYRTGGLYLVPTEVEGEETEKSRFFHDLRGWNSHVRLVALELFIEEGVVGMQLLGTAEEGPSDWPSLIDDFKHYIVPALSENVSSDQIELILRTHAGLETIFTEDRFEILAGTIRTASDPVSSAIYAASKRNRDCKLVHPLLAILGMIATVPATEDALRLFEDLSRHRDQIIELLAVLVLSNDAAGFRIQEYLMAGMGQVTPRELSADPRILDALVVVQKEAPAATRTFVKARPQSALSTMEGLTGLLLTYSDMQILEPRGTVDQAMRYWKLQNRKTLKTQAKILTVLTGLNTNLEEVETSGRLTLDMHLQEKLLSYYDMTNYEQMINGSYYKHYPVVRDTVLNIFAPMAYLMDEHILEGILFSYRRDNDRQLSGRAEEQLDRLEPVQ